MGMSTKRRESLGNIQNFLKTLAYWKRQPSLGPTNSGNDRKTEIKTSSSAGNKVERSKSFSIKCDKGYATYYHIEPKRRNVNNSPRSTASLPKTSEPSTFILPYDNLTLPCPLEQHQSLLNNNYKNPFSNFHEVGLPLPPINVSRR